MIAWLKSLGVAFVTLACLIAVGAGLLIAASALGGAGRPAFWIGLGSLGFALVFVTIGLFLVNRSYKWRHGWPWSPRDGS